MGNYTWGYWSWIWLAMLGLLVWQTVVWSAERSHKDHSSAAEKQGIFDPDGEREYHLQPIPDPRGHDLEIMIVWPHATHLFYEIARAVDQAKFRIQHVHRRTFADDAEFSAWVHEVYALDQLPAEHLGAKLKLLLDSTRHLTQRDVFVLVYQTPDRVRRLFGTHPYQVSKNLLANRLKEELRDRFNPRDPETGKRTEHHVVHTGDDAENQGLARLLFDRPLEGFASRLVGAFASPWHFPLPPGFRTEVRELKTLLVRQFVDESGATEDVALPDSHAVAFCRQSDMTRYVRYYDQHKGTRLTDYHAPSKYLDMIHGFMSYPYVHRGSCHFVMVRDDLIVDGGHRAAYLLAQGLTHLEVLNIEPEPERWLSDELLSRVADVVEQQSGSCCLLRPSVAFPLSLSRGKDIDLMVPVLADAVVEWRSVLAQAFPDFQLEVTHVSEHIAHLDLADAQGLVLRFDLTDAYPEFTSFVRRIALPDALGGSRGFRVPFLSADKASREACAQAKPWHRSFLKYFYPLDES